MIWQFCAQLFDPKWYFGLVVLVMNKKYDLDNVVSCASCLNSLLCLSIVVVKEIKYVDENGAVKNRCTEGYFFTF